VLNAGILFVLLKYITRACNFLNRFGTNNVLLINRTELSNFVQQVLLAFSGKSTGDYNRRE